MSDDTQGLDIVDFGAVQLAVRPYKSLGIRAGAALRLFRARPFAEPDHATRLITTAAHRFAVRPLSETAFGLPPPLRTAFFLSYDNRFFCVRQVLRRAGR